MGQGQFVKRERETEIHRERDRDTSAKGTFSKFLCIENYPYEVIHQLVHLR